MTLSLFWPILAPFSVTIATINMKQGTTLVATLCSYFANQYFCNKYILNRLHSDTIYENMPMPYAVIFHCCKMNNFQIEKCDTFLVFFFAVNIDRGYTLEPPE